MVSYESGIGNRNMNYDLRTGGKGRFYSTLGEYTDYVIKEGMYRFDVFFKKYHSLSSIPDKKDNTQILLSLLIVGSLWEEYRYKKWLPGYIFAPVFNGLYKIRTYSKPIKNLSDIVRGSLAGLILNQSKKSPSSISKSNFRLFTKWLEATCEYQEELKYLNHLKPYWDTLNSSDFETCFKRSVRFAKWFYRGGRFYLGDYTVNVNGFIKQNERRYRYKENYFFTIRTEAIYFLNMVGAEILNRALSKDFKQTKRQVILLPTCMRSNSKCKAVKNGNNLFCVQCQYECNIGKIKAKFGNTDTEIVVIPHSSSFSEFLKPYANQRETGLIGVACILNLLKGGFEMMQLNIPSQCVFLDYSGCDKHWCQKSIPTTLSNSQINSIITPRELKLPQEQH